MDNEIWQSLVNINGTILKHDNNFSTVYDQLDKLDTKVKWLYIMIMMMGVVIIILLLKR